SLARLLVLEADRVLTFGPWRKREAEEPLVDVVRHDVVERRRVVPDDEHDDADAVVRHRRYLRVEPWQIPTVVGQEMSAIRGRPASHPISRVEDLAPAADLEARIGEGDGGRERLLDGRRRQDLPAFESPL